MKDGSKYAQSQHGEQCVVKALALEVLLLADNWDIKAMVHILDSGVYSNIIAVIKVSHD
jgi:hypothetical protein